MLVEVWMSTAVRRLILTVAALTLNLMIAWMLGVMGWGGVAGALGGRVVHLADISISFR